MSSFAFAGAAFAKTTPISSEALACVATAVGTREDAIASGLTAYTTAMSSAFSSRKSALVAAWAMPARTDRNAAIKSAWSAFHSSEKTATASWKQSKKEAWSVFKTASVDCKAGSTGESGYSGQ